METGYAAGSAGLKSLVSLATQYGEQHSGVKFNMIPSGTNYEQTLKVDLAAHNPPDMWMTHGWSRDRYSQFLVPLQNQPWNKFVNPALDAAMRTSSGAIYALPLDTDVAGIIYNGDVLSKAGVDPASIRTWSDFDNAAKKIKAMGVTPIEVSGKADAPAGNLIDFVANGMYSPSELAALKKGSFNKGRYASMLQQVADWQKEGFINPDYSSATQDDESKTLAAGQSAFVFQQNGIASDALGYSPKANLGFLPIPSPSGKTYLLGGELDAFGVSKTSSHIKEATGFLNFLAKPANETLLAKDAGAIPGLTTAQASKGTILNSYNEWVTKDKTPLEPYFDRVYLPNGMWNTLVTTADSVITGQASVAAATDQVATDFKSLYGKK